MRGQEGEQINGRQPMLRLILLGRAKIGSIGAHRRGLMDRFLLGNGKLRPAMTLALLFNDLDAGLRPAPGGSEPPGRDCRG